MGCLSHAPTWGLGLKPRHVPWQGIEPVTFQFADQCSIHRVTPARAQREYLNCSFLFIPTCVPLYTSLLLTRISYFYLNLIHLSSPSTIFYMYYLLLRPTLTTSVTCPSWNFTVITMYTSHKVLNHRLSYIASKISMCGTHFPSQMMRVHHFSYTFHPDNTKYIVSHILLLLNFIFCEFRKMWANFNLVL